MTKFEPLGACDRANQIVIEPIENGYLVKRHSSYGNAIIHCELGDLLAVIASALPPMVKVTTIADASEYMNA